MGLRRFLRHQFFYIRDLFQPPQGGDVEYQYYVRTGDCNQCGQCCSGIALVHNQSAIQTVEEFDQLKKKYPDYRHFEPIEETQHGIVFKCKNLGEDNACGIYDDRPLFCRKYPSEGTLLLGGQLAPECSYGFTKKIAFENILKAKSIKSPLDFIGLGGNCKAGKLMNDVLLPIGKKS